MTCFRLLSILGPRLPKPCPGPWVNIHPWWFLTKTMGKHSASTSGAHGKPNKAFKHRCKCAWQKTLKCRTTPMKCSTNCLVRKALRQIGNASPAPRHCVRGSPSSPVAQALAKPPLWFVCWLCCNVHRTTSTTLCAFIWQRPRARRPVA